ncbi:MAG: mechanosensitive ion channel [Betaproteobacteria bacterium]|nr:mechanosensitive ion channel [Betaproteobacteria bacterium]
MKENQFGRLLIELWKDLQDPSILWQAGVVALCVALAWWASRLAQWRAPEESSRALKMGAGSLRRVVLPLAAMLLLYTGRWALEHWHAANLVTVAIALAGALAGIRFAVYLLRLAVPASGFLDAFERAVVALIWAVVALHLTGMLPEIVNFLKGVRFPLGKHELSAWTLVQGGFWVALTLLVALWGGGALEARLMRAQGMHTSLRVVLGRLGKAVLLFAAVLLVLPLVGIDLTVLSVFGGALGVGIGFGLQKIASNYLSGFIILLDRSIRIGDMITADGHYGEVTRITTRYVVVRSLAGIEAIIPNDTLVTTTVLNHSYTDKKVRLAVKVQVSYDTNVDDALRVLAQVAAGHPRVLEDPPPAALVTALADSGVDLEINFWIGDPENGSGSVRSDISARLLAEFRRSGIQIPFPQREVRILGGAPSA